MPLDPRIVEAANEVVRQKIDKFVREAVKRWEAAARAVRESPS